MHRGTRIGGIVAALVVALAMAGCAAPPEDPPIIPPAASPTSGAVPNFGHVVVLVLENTNYDETFGPGGTTRAPYLNSLASSYALGTQYSGIDHASLTNYIAMTSGQTPKTSTKIDCPLYDCIYDASVQHVGDQVEASGRTWKAYMEGMPTACAHGSEGSFDPYFLYIPPFNTYATRHNPFMYYRNMIGNPARCVAHDVPYTDLATDLAANQLPNLSYISPDLCNDGHEDQCGLPAADAWAAAEVPKILASPEFQADGVLFITFDEAEGTDATGCCGNSAGGRVGNIVVSPAFGRTGGFQSTVPENHYSLLRTIEDAWSLPLLGHAQDDTIAPMTEYFTPPA